MPVSPSGRAPVTQPLPLGPTSCRTQRLPRVPQTSDPAFSTGSLGTLQVQAIAEEQTPSCSWTLAAPHSSEISEKVQSRPQAEACTGSIPDSPLLQ